MLQDGEGSIHDDRESIDAVILPASASGAWPIRWHLARPPQVVPAVLLDQFLGTAPVVVRPAGPHSRRMRSASPRDRAQALPRGGERWLGGDHLSRSVVEKGIFLPSGGGRCLGARMADDPQKGGPGVRCGQTLVRRTYTPIVGLTKCKFWKGPASLHGALDQIIDYSLWRDGKAAILLFNRFCRCSERNRVSLADCGGGSEARRDGISIAASATRRLKQNHHRYDARF